MHTEESSAKWQHLSIIKYLNFNPNPMKCKPEIKKNKSIHENPKKSWLKYKGYRHLTNKTTFSKNNKKKNEQATDNIIRLVTNPKLVEKHAFFPLLHKTITERRYKKISYNPTAEELQDEDKLKRLRLAAFHPNGKPKRSHSNNSKERPLHYATHIDAPIYAYYSNQILQKKYEDYLKKDPKLSKCITAYRRIPIEEGTEKPCKSSIHFAKEVFCEIKQHSEKYDECCAIAFDIKNFFSSLDHKKLKKAWSKLLGKRTLPKDHYNIFKSITKYSYILLDDLRTGKNNSFDEQQLAYNRQKGIQAFFESPKALREAIKEGELQVRKNQFHNKKKEVIGIPQGLPISAMLANLYLLEFDKAVLKKLEELEGGFYRRYSDDIVILCSRRQQKEVEDFIYKEIKNHKLEIQPEKTEVSYFKYKESKLQVCTLRQKQVHDKVVEYEHKNYPFSYLGFDFYGHKVLIKAKSVSKFYRRMKSAVNIKARRIKAIKKKELVNTAPLFKRRIYRSFTRKGLKRREWIKYRRDFKKDDRLGYFTFTKYKSNEEYKYRGNYLNYVNRASDIMGEPAIKRQFKRHFKILKKYIKTKVDASNV